MAGFATREAVQGLGADRRASFIGLFLLLAASTMVFMAFTAAFVMRRDMENWIGVHKPPILFANTAILLASSGVLELSRRALKAGERTRFQRLWGVATALGVLFLVGQALAWLQLNRSGIHIASTPGSSFLYVLTASHAFHLVGGLAALVYVYVRAVQLRLGPAKRTMIDITAIFWHFLDAIWIYLMILLYVWG